MSNNEDIVDDNTPVQHSVWSLIYKGLSSMASRAVTKSNDGRFNGIIDKLGNDLTSRLNTSLKHVAYGHQLGNKTVHHEVELAVHGSFVDLNITDDSNHTQEHRLVAKLDQEIELDAFGKAIEQNTTVNWRAGDFFHKMALKDETLFVWLVCMGVIVPIIIITLFAIYVYKRKQENVIRRDEMLLREQPEFSMEERSPTEHKGNMEEDVADLDFRNSYQA